MLTARTILALSSPRRSSVPSPTTSGPLLHPTRSGRGSPNLAYRPEFWLPVRQLARPIYAPGLLVHCLPVYGMWHCGSTPGWNRAWSWGRLVRWGLLVPVRTPHAGSAVRNGNGWPLLQQLPSRSRSGVVPRGADLAHAHWACHVDRGGQPAPGHDPHANSVTLSAYVGGAELAGCVVLLVRRPGC